MLRYSVENQFFMLAGFLSRGAILCIPRNVLTHTGEVATVPLEDDDERQDREDREDAANELKSDEYHALIKLAHAINSKKITIFDDNEARALKRVAAIYMALDTIGAMATVLKNILIAIGVIVGAYTALKLGFLDWIKGASK